MEWQQALKVCFSVVGQASSDQEVVEPQFHDEHAVHTMEDISKIYANLGNSESSVAWLTQAAIDAPKAGGLSQGSKTHIVDKLVGALVASGNLDEALFWQNKFPVGGDD